MSRVLPWARAAGFLALLGAANASAQIVPPPPGTALIDRLRFFAVSRVTASVGYVQSEMIGRQATQYGLDNPVPGIYAGLGVEIPLMGSWLKTVPVGRYIARGYELDDTRGTYKLEYVEVIAPLVVEVPLAGRLMLNVFGGPGFGLSMGCKISSTTTNTINCQNDELGYKVYDLTAFGGTGLAFAVPEGIHALLSAQLEQSFESIDASGSGLDLRNRSLLIGVQLSFPIGERHG